ncbi:MAG: DUF362 domain-containing protein [Myxococcota bacterium]|nr:DUF362 domain-containing protein [Myxococcota bacterium]
MKHPTSSAEPDRHGHGGKMQHLVHLARHKAPWLIGALCLLWFVIRVGPKPSRAAEPCQQAALVTIGGFVGWLAGIAGLSVLARRAWTERGRQGMVAAVALASSLGVWMMLGMPASPAKAAPPWTPTDPPNAPMGVARGIHPGRVAWSHHPNAALWDGNNGTWWDPASNNQAAIDLITSTSLRAITGKNTDAAAWNALFTDFNQRSGKGALGHAAGELIVVKINQNPARDGNNDNGTPDRNQIVGHPNLIISLVGSLVSAGVEQSDIMVYDASRYIADSVYLPLKAAFPNLRIMQEKEGSGREVAQWTENAILYPSTAEQVRMTTVAKQVIDAAYMINMAIMKTHGADVATLCGKNHWGSVRDGRDHYWINGDRPMGSYSPIVNLFGSKHLGGKTILYMIDTIYSANGSDSGPSRWDIAPFNGAWPSSLFVSQDPVAIDSVGWDFANANWGLPHNTDNYLHESALADNPPSGTNYAPDGATLASQGVHEHWNNVNEKKYSRNLNPATGTGIELVYVEAQACADDGCDFDDGTGTDGGGDSDTDADSDGDTDSGSVEDMSSDDSCGCTIPGAARKVQGGLLTLLLQTVRLTGSLERAH